MTLVAILSITGQQNAFGYFVFGTELLDNCTYEDEGDIDKFADKSTSCYQYLQGFWDAAEFFQSGVDNKQYYCVSGMYPGALKKIFVQYAKAHFQDLEFSAVSTLIPALREKWPCK